MIHNNFEMFKNVLQTRGRAGCMLHEGEVWMVGGFKAGTLDGTEIYNIENDEWRQGPTLPRPIERAVMVQDPRNRKPILVGGWTKDEPVCCC